MIASNVVAERRAPDFEQDQANSPKRGFLSWPFRAAEYRAPPGARIYAIGDVHGRADLLRALIKQIQAEEATLPPARTTLVFLGDYVDRGAESRQVIDYLLELQRDRFDLRFLRGNHEAALLNFLSSPETGSAWMAFGGLETLHSYGVNVAQRNGSSADLLRIAAALRAALPREHLDFLRKLETFVRLGDYLFVHAGLRPGRALADQTEEDMLEIREPFLRSNGRREYVVVHGHSPVPQAARHRGRIAVDTGAYATGRLSAVCLEEIGARFIST